MFEQSSQSLKVALSVLCVALLVVLVLVVLGENGLFGKKASAPEPSATTSQSQTQNIQPVPPTEVHGVLGTVEQISGQEITLKDFRKSMTAASSSVSQSARMIVTVNQSTIIERLAYKDQATIAKESDDFIKNIQKIQAQNLSIPPTPPEPFTLEKISLSDIKAGDTVIATSAEDISALTKFTATKIEVRK